MERNSLKFSHLPITGVNSVVEHAGGEDTLGYVLAKVKEGIPRVVEAQVIIRATPDPDQRRKLKRELLPAFALGSYVQEYVKGEKCIQTPGMIIDIDHLPEEKFQPTFERICATPEVHAAFRSPSGDGIKVILLFDQPLEAIEKDGTNLLPQFYRDIYRFYGHRLFQLEELDKTTCNVDRLCYFAFDPDLYLNPNPKLLSFADDKEAIDLFLAPSIKPPAVARQLGTRPTYRTADFLDPASLSEAVKERITSAIPYLRDLDEPAWFRVALALKPYGQFGWETFLDLSTGGRYADDEETIKAKFEAANSQFEGPRVGLGTLFYFAKKKGWVAPAVNYLSSAPDNFWAFRYKAGKEGPKEEVIFPALKVMRFLQSHGFWIYSLQSNGGFDLVYVRDNVIYPTNETLIIQYLRGQVEAAVADDKKSRVLEAFAASYGLFSNSSFYVNLPILTPNFLQDTSDSAYVFFSNCWVHVNSTGITSYQYSELPGHVHEKMIVNRSFELTDNRSDFETFLENVTKTENPDASRKRLDSLKTAIGYLTHGYRKVDKAVILTDEKFTLDLEEANGGTGKSLIAKSLGYLRPLVTIDGKSWNNGHSFKFQEVTPETKLVHFNDLKANFNFDEIFGLITESTWVDIKNKAGFRVEGIKFILSTNYSLKGNGSAYERRQHIVELNAFYNAVHTPADDFSKRFFDQWDEGEWHAFFGLFLRCVQQYMAEGLMAPLVVNTEKRKIQLEIGEFYFNHLNPSYIASLINCSSQGLSIKRVFEKFRAEYPEDTRNLNLNQFSKKINLLMKYYDVGVKQARKYVDGFKHTLYSYMVSANTNAEVIQELEELRAEGNQRPCFGGFSEHDFFTERGVA